MPRGSISMQHRMKKLFSEGFTAIDIAEPLPLIDCRRPSGEALELMEKTRLPVLGVLEDGSVTGHVRIEDLGGGTCSESARPFDSVPVIEEGASFRETFEAMAGSPFCFVRGPDGVKSLVCRMDIQKPPVRMWLFGMVTIIEMFLTRIILDAYPKEEWKELMPRSRLHRAQRMMKERTRRGEGVRLIDCLQLSDKANVVMKDPELFSQLRFESKRSAKEAVKEFESLRNSLAHSHDLSLSWEMILNISRDMETIVARI